jgi:outer membrane protein assembly factor BamB
MRRGTKGTQVSIVGVAVFETREAQEERRRRESILSPYVGEGAVYALGLAYPPPGVLPAGEAAICALAAGGNGEIFGATSGRRAHLFRMSKPLMVGHMATLDGVQSVAASLVIADDGRLYGAVRARGGPLFACNVGEGELGPYHNKAASVEMLLPPFEDDCAASLAVSRDGRVIAGVAEGSGRIFLMTTRKRTPRVLRGTAAANEACSRILGAGPDNFFYGSGKDGRLYKVSPEGDVQWLSCCVPCRKGKAYLARVVSFTVARSGLLYGGTEDGYLFSFDTSTGELVSHGRANDIPDLHSLAEGADGLIYGIVGRGRYASRLVRFHPGRGEWADLGLLRSHGHYPWTGYQVGSLTAGCGGMLCAGENDRFGHLFLYHPPSADR